MNKNSILLFVLTALLGVIGCSAPDTNPGTGVASGQGSGLSTNFADAMPVVSQLAAGTVALEGGDNAVSDTQAAELLPLWQAYSSLAAGTGTAQAELDALVSQIERTMTAAQIAEIRSLQMTNAKLQEMIQAGEIQLGRGGFGDRNNQEQNDQAGGRGQGGGPPGGGALGGGPPDGGGGFGNLSQEDIATRRAERADAAGGEEALQAIQMTGAVVRLLNVKVNGDQAQPPQGENPFAIANQTVADALGITVDELLAGAAEEAGGKSIQALIEENREDVESVRASLEEALADTRAGQNGNMTEFIETYLASSGRGRGAPQGDGE